MQHFEQEIYIFQNKLVLMAKHAEMAANQAILALSNRDSAKAAQVIADDSILDRLEMEIDNMAIDLLAKAPLASDLRLITVGMRISHDLERVGDEAVKIAKRVQELCAEPPLEETVQIPELAELALENLKTALATFIARDSQTARKLVSCDKEVDKFYHEIQTRLVAMISQQRELISRCLKLMVIAKALERIADHAINIAEEVVFLCEAQDIRHAKSVLS